MSSTTRFDDVSASPVAQDVAARLGAVHQPRSAQPRAAPLLCCAALALADLAALVLVETMVLVLAGPPGITPLLLAGFLNVAMLISLGARGRYTQRAAFWDELGVLVNIGLCALAAWAMLGLLYGDLPACLPALAALLLLPLVASLFNRSVKRSLLRAGLWRLPVAVVGEGATAAAAEALLTCDPLLGYAVVRRFRPAELLPPNGATPTLGRTLQDCGAQFLAIAVDADATEQLGLFHAALRERIPFGLVPAAVRFPAFANETMQAIAHDHSMVRFRNRLTEPLPRATKTALDLTAAAILLLLLSPLLAAIAVAVRLDGGPALFAHRRVGQGGRSFNCLKFRTMVVDAGRVLAETLANDPARAAEWAATQKLRDDPRVTRLGRLLRSTSLDELPQLFNVLRLEMSLVGPRPIVTAEVPHYGLNIAQYYAARPGLTGLWQVSGRSNTSYAYRVQLDVWYVNNWSVWNDITVLLRTVPAVLQRRGAC